jgi:hypothetical protein
MRLAIPRSTQHLVLCPALASRGVKGAVQGRSEAQGREPARASNGRRERAQRPLMDLGAFQNPSRQRAGMFHPLPSASRRGVKALLAAFWLPVARVGPRQSIFACAKLSQVNSAQSGIVSSGDTSQCGCGYLRWWAPAIQLQGPLRFHPHPFGARPGSRSCAPRAASGGPLHLAVRHPPVSHATPHRIGTDHLRGRVCLSRLQEEGRLRASSQEQKHAPPKRLAQIT